VGLNVIANNILQFSSNVVLGAKSALLAAAALKTKLYNRASTTEYTMSLTQNIILHFRPEITSASKPKKITF